MHLLFAKGIEKSFGDRLILRDASLRIEAGERVGLVGANGAGKSTLLKLLVGLEELDHGVIDCSDSVSYCPQDPIFDGDTVETVMSSAIQWHADLLQDFENASINGDMERLATVQDQLDVVGWDWTHRIESVCTKVKAPPMDAKLSLLSGGERRRISLACTLLSGSQFLIFDEPTNHLDADTIEWFEGYLRGFSGGILLVTHDRYLLESVATRIVEIEDGVCIDYKGSYGDYLLARAERQVRLRQSESRRLRLIAQEAAWAARSPAARSTKQKARLLRLNELLEQRPMAREKELEMGFKTRDRFGSILLDLHGLSKSYDNRFLFKDISIGISPGDRIGIIGPNGCGKSTLLKVIAGLIKADGGEILRSPRLSIGVLDQNRTGLTETDSVFEAAGGGNDFVNVGDNPVHVIGFLERFLFHREHLDQKVSLLSGGEKARLLMAKLMLQDCACLLLDEPTNDLDLLTLRALETSLLNFEGAVLFVTHDRALLDRVCTKVLSFEGNGEVVAFADRQQALRSLNKKEASQVQAKPSKVREHTPKISSWSAKLEKELNKLPDKIEQIESEIGICSKWLSNPENYSQPKNVEEYTRELKTKEATLEKLFDRWEELSEIKERSQ